MVSPGRPGLGNLTVGLDLVEAELPGSGQPAGRPDCLRFLDPWLARRSSALASQAKNRCPRAGIQPEPKPLQLIETGLHRSHVPLLLGLEQDPERARESYPQMPGELASQAVVEQGEGSGMLYSQRKRLALPSPQVCSQREDGQVWRRLNVEPGQGVEVWKKNALGPADGKLGDHTLRHHERAVEGR